MVRISVGDLVFAAKEYLQAMAHGVRALAIGHLLLLQARWSGEAAWMPLGSLDVGVGAENDMQHPAPGQILLHPMGISETEILIPYGETVFASKVGPLRGNHVMTIMEGEAQLAELGRRVVWEGAQPIRFEAFT